jgi:hypothetical protein
MGSFGKAGRTGNVEGKCDLAGILPIAYSGVGALAESAELAFAALRQTRQMQRMRQDWLSHPFGSRV